jgi:hypothetical protein
MKFNKPLQDFNYHRNNDTAYCIEWGIDKGLGISDAVIDRVIKELLEKISINK